MKDGCQFEHCLIDEAGQALEPQCVAPLSLLRENGSLSLCGDHKQLPAFCNNQALKEHMQCSMLERLVHMPGLKHVMLNVQYRMVEPSARWPSKAFYQSNLKTTWESQNVASMPAGFNWPNKSSPICFVHHTHNQSSFQNSHSNIQEAVIISNIVENLVAEGIEACDIGIITPYDGQRQELRRILRKFFNSGKI